MMVSLYILGAWFLFGLFYGLKIIFVEKIYDIIQENSKDEKGKLMNFSNKSKYHFLVTCILFGGFIYMVELMFRLSDRGENK